MSLYSRSRAYLWCRTGIGASSMRKYKDGHKAKVTSGFGVRDHAVSLAFAVTDYKLQGMSLDVLVLSVGPRSFNPAIVLSGVYVLASRVKTRAGLRVLKLSCWDHLKTLRPEVALEIWDQSYGDDHSFKHERLKAAAGRAGERLRTAHTAAKDHGKKAAKADLKAKATAQKKAARRRASSRRGPQLSTPSRIRGRRQLLSTPSRIRGRRQLPPRRGRRVCRPLALCRSSRPCRTSVRWMAGRKLRGPWKQTEPLFTPSWIGGWCLSTGWETLATWTPR